MPSESDLAATFDASRSTIIRALREVEEQGLIERRQGSGSFVTPKAREREAVPCASIGLLQMAQSGRFADSVSDQIQSQLNALLQRRGSALIAHSIERDESPLAVARALIDQRVGGIFMVPIPSSHAGGDVNAQVAALFAKANLPLVLLDGDYATFPDRSSLDVVGIENRHCGYLQAEHLLAMGLRRVLFVGSNPPVPTAVERQLGYMDAMTARGIDVPSDWICHVASNDIDERFVAGLLERCRPEGIVFKSDEFAALTMRHLPALGIRIPQDLKLVGFDDRPIASLLPVTLTTVRQPIADIAEAALMLMESRIAQPAWAARRIQVAGKLVVRQSSYAK